MKHPSIPTEVATVADTLTRAGFEAYLVGGCVRDILLGRTPKDWDITTNATPLEIQKFFSDSVYENQFGTVGVKTRSEDPTVAVVEVTTYRVEGAYSDKRHPDEVRFAKTVEEDLARRDFTVNAMAMLFTKDKGQKTDSNTELVDPFGGQADFTKKLIRTVGKPEDRFGEDALRLLRAVRLAVELEFRIEKETAAAIVAQAGGLEAIAKERIRDEFTKLIMAPAAAFGVRSLEELGLLRFIVPELRDGIACAQNRHHIYTVFDHNVRALDYAAGKGYSLEVRLASLFHDIAKPQTKGGEGPSATFYGHEYAGARMVLRILDRLRFSKEVTERVAHLVRSHMFYYNTDEVTAAGVRRFLARVGPENVDDIMKVREADRIGSGVPKAVVYKMRHLLFMIEKVRRDPVHPKMLAVRGDDVMRLLTIPAGPRIGWILNTLLDEVLEDPAKNTHEYLEPKVRELGALSDVELTARSEAARARTDEFEEGVEAGMKKKYAV
jgi:poly(A) polymerase/tRNA nucleotidyltransferase (CCA-adding enzyme)